MQHRRLPVVDVTLDGEAVCLLKDGRPDFHALRSRAITGLPFPEALRRRVLAPLGMVDTTFDPRPQRPRVQ